MLYSINIIYYIIYIIYSKCLHIVIPQYLWDIGPKPTYIATFMAAQVSYIKQHICTRPRLPTMHNII